MSTVHLKLDELEKLMKALKKAPPVVRVGILGDHAQRRGKGPNNATIGACHEFGTTKIPMRSFLRVPISENLGKEIEGAGAFTPAALQEVVKGKSLIPWLKKIGIAAEAVVADAFDSGGNGKWAPWAPSTVRAKKNRFGRREINTIQILVETQQLRNSITSEVKETNE